jgi:L-fuconolactonase
VEVVDAQVHIPRIVVDWRSGHPRATDADVPAWDPPRQPVFEPADWDTILAGTLTAMDAAGVDALLVDEWLGHDGLGRSQPGHSVDEGYRYRFDFSAYAANRYPERFSFLSRVHWTDPDLDDVTSQLAGTPGMRCLRVDPMPWLTDIDAFRDGQYGRVFDAALRHDLPVFVWSNGPNLGYLDQYLQRYPDIRFVIDHLGAVAPPADAVGVDRYAQLLDTLSLGARYENLSVKWSTVETQSVEPYPYRDTVPYLVRALEVFGPERIIWASDWSQHRLQQSWVQSYSWLLDCAELSRDDKEWLLGRSLRTLLRWPAVTADVGVGLYFNCSHGHASMRITGVDENEFVVKMQSHLDLWHPQPALHGNREQLLARARG